MSIKINNIWQHSEKYFKDLVFDGTYHEIEKYIRKYNIRKSVRKVLKESTEVDLSKISTSLLKQMMELMGKNLPRATEDDRKMLRAIQLELSTRQDK